MTSTSTSMLTPTTAMLSGARLRVTMTLLVAIAFLSIAFAVGRSTASVQRITKVIAPPSMSVPAPGTVTNSCRIGRPC